MIKGGGDANGCHKIIPKVTPLVLFYDIHFRLNNPRISNGAFGADIVAPFFGQNFRKKSQKRQFGLAFPAVQKFCKKFLVL